MDVCEAVTSRRAVQGFTARPVPRETLERVLSAAAWAPSGSNLQHWHAYMLTGVPLAGLKKRAGERITTGNPWDGVKYEQYPPTLKSPYRERRSAFGAQRHGALGIPHEDLEAHQRAAVANWDCFGLSAALFCYIDRGLGPAQVVRRRHVSADRHAAVSGRRAVQLPAEVPHDCRGGPVTAGRGHSLLRHVEGVRRRQGGLHPHGPVDARRDSHVR
jgi:nitroreductase